MQEGLDLHARHRRRFADLLQRQLAGQGDAGEAQVAQRLDPGAAVGGELGAGVELELGEVPAGDPGHAQVLDDDRVGAQVRERAQGLDQPVELLVQHQRVHGHEHAPDRLERAREPEQLVQLPEGEVLGVGPGREALQPQVHRVGAVLEGRQAGLQASGGREQLGAARG